MTARDVPPVSAIADVLALWGDDGWLTPPLSPVVAATGAILGRVRIVVLAAASASASAGPSLTPMYDLMSTDLSGRFVIFAGAHPVGGAVWGEILTFAARQRNACGAVVDGFVRDVPAMNELGVPVYARAVCVGGPNGRAHVVGVDVETHVGGVVIDPDDHVVADATGCVRIRAARLGEVLGAARRYAAAEQQVTDALTAGEPLSSAYRYKKLAVDELREVRQSRQ